MPAGCSDVHQIHLSIYLFPHTADKCLKGLIPRDFKIRLQIFILGRQRERKGGEATSKETRTAANTDKPAPVAHRTSNMAVGFYDVKVP